MTSLNVCGKCLRRSRGCCQLVNEEMMKYAKGKLEVKFVFRKELVCF